MSVSLLCMSHTPLMGFNEPGPGVREEVDALFDRARAFVAEVDPTLDVTFGPDHYNGFFYDLMPPFVISPEQLAQLCRAVVSVLGGSGPY